MRRNSVLEELRVSRFADYRIIMTAARLFTGKLNKNSDRVSHETVVECCDKICAWVFTSISGWMQCLCLLFHACSVKGASPVTVSFSLRAERFADLAVCYFVRRRFDCITLVTLDRFDWHQAERLPAAGAADAAAAAAGI